MREVVEEQLGLDRPLRVQFFDFMSGVVRGDFGDSLWQKVPALPLVLDRLPNTLLLASVTMAVSIPTAVILGSLAAVRPGTIVDRFINVVSLFGVAMVEFWLALMLIFFFAVRLGWLPTGGTGSARHLVLPVLTLSYATVGRVSQLVRSAMLEEYGKTYVKLLRAKGASEMRVFGHALKNASIPILTLTGDEFASQANGAMVVETVYGYPGVGALLIHAILNRDLTLIEACVFVLVVVIVTINLLVDVTYSWLDPKIRYS